MNQRFLIPLLFSTVAAAAATTVTTTVLERGPHSQIVQSVRAAVDEQGKPVSVTNTFTQLQTGLNRWSQVDDAWVSATEQVERVNGTLVARQTQHQVIFADRADATNGTIDLTMVNGARFRVRPTGIAYTEFTDGQPGRSVFVAELQSSAAQLTAPNEIAYFAALEYGDLAYDLSLAGLEQNVVFRQRPPRPQDLQMDPALVRIECWNQVLEAPAPAERFSTITRSDGSVDQETQLDFGPMQINIGRAYAVNGAPDALSVRVAKEWAVISNSVWLIESVPYAELAPLLATLPAQQASRSLDRDKLRRLWANQSAGKRALPLSLPEVRLAKAPARTDTRVASVRLEQDRSAPGVNLDWTLLGSATNTVLKGDTTYYVSGLVTLSASGSNGVTTIEGGTCVKFTNDLNAKIIFSGPIDCRADAYRIAVFTSKDSDEVGEKITGSTGNPTNFYGNGIEVTTSSTLKNLRFAYASTAIRLDSGQTLNLWDSQFVKCSLALNGNDHNDTFNLENDLFYDLDALFSTAYHTNTVNGVNLTVHDCGTLASAPDLTSSGFLTNSLLANITNSIPSWIVLDSTTPQAMSDLGVFQSVGAASHYLAPNSKFRGTGSSPGTSNIDASLLGRLRQKTTFPPLILSTNFTANTTLRARDDIRDTSASAVDLGFHYDVLDYAWSDLTVTNATLTLTNGVAVAIYGVKGTTLNSGAKFISEGNPVRQNRLTRYQTVQEQPVVWGSTGNEMDLFFLYAPTTPFPQLRLTYTDVSLMADAFNRRTLLQENASAVTPFAVYHSQLRGLSSGWSDSPAGSSTISWTNNLVERSTWGWTKNDSANGFTLNLYNNLFRGGTNNFRTGLNSVSWTVKDNLFDNETITKDGTPDVANSNNGYYPATAPRLPGSGGDDVILTNVDYQTSSLGSFYYPTNGTNLARLLNAGSRTASSAGLSTFTTTTNNVADSGSVDIGYHFFAVNPNSVVTIVTTANAVEPIGANGTVNGLFTVSRTGPTTNSLTVYYSVGGTAVPNVNYSNNLSGSISIAAGFSSNNITVTPIDDGVIDPPLTVSATLLQTTNTYLVGSPDRATLTITNSDQPVFTTVISNLHLPVGIDYHSPSNVLIVSLNFDTGLPLNFIQVRTNDATTNWTTISNMTGEINLACVRSTNGGWTVGDLYFNTGEGGQIGRVPATPSSFNTNWTTLPDSQVQGLYFDQTGVFTNNLVAATAGSGNVWLITSLGQSNMLASIGLPLECVLTLPNDSNKYGPWAGKILTGNESDFRLFTIDTNGVVTPWPFAAPAENLNLIPANQDLYAVDAGMQGSTNGRVWKISRNAFTNYVGDILVTHEGNLDGQPRHLIVHWDGTSFVTTDLINTNALNYEQATFAPVSFDSH